MHYSLFDWSREAHKGEHLTSDICHVQFQMTSVQYSCSGYKPSSKCQLPDDRRIIEYTTRSESKRLTLITLVQMHSRVCLNNRYNLQITFLLISDVCIRIGIVKLLPTNCLFNRFDICLLLSIRCTPNGHTLLYTCMTKQTKINEFIKEVHKEKRKP